jgi:hypothetical protein
MDELDGYSDRSGHPLSYVRTALRPRQCKAPRPGGPQDHGSLSPVHFDFRRSVARADRRGDPRSGHRIRLHPVPGNQCRRKLAPGRRGRGRDGHLRGVFFLGSGTGPALIGPFLAAREGSRSAAINPLYTLDAAPFSDSFLAIVPALILALTAASGLRDSTKPEKERTRNEYGRDPGGGCDDSCFVLRSPGGRMMISPRRDAGDWS